MLVLSSAWEGFGNVLVEAMAAKTPVISTDCPSGPAEILADGKYGTLVAVGDVNAMAQAMIETIKQKPNLEQIKSRAREFSLEKAVSQYLDLIAISSKMISQKADPLVD